MFASSSETLKGVLLRTGKVIITVLILLAVSAAGGSGIFAEESSDISKKPDTVKDLPRKTRLALFNSQKACEENDFEKAAELLSEFIRENPDNDHYIIRFHLGNYLSRTGKDQQALESYKKAVDLEERFAQGWLNYGETAYQLEKYGTAADAILKGFKLSEDKRGHLLYYAAAAYIMDSKPLRAADLLEELVSGSYGEPRLEWYKSLLSSCMEGKQIQRGSMAADSMLEQFPDNPDAWKLAFQFHAGSGYYRRAAVALTITGYLRPLTSEERVQLGDMYNALGVPQQAGACYRAAISDSSSAREFEKLASAYLAAYEYDAALKTLRRALDSKPTVRLWALMGDLHYMDENFSDAYRAFEKCIQMDENYGRAYLMMGYCALEMGRIEEAAARLKTAAEIPDYRETALKLLKRAEAEKK